MGYLYADGLVYYSRKLKELISSFGERDIDNAKTDFNGVIHETISDRINSEYEDFCNQPEADKQNEWEVYVSNIQTARALNQEQIDYNRLEQIRFEHLIQEREYLLKELKRNLSYLQRERK